MAETIPTNNPLNTLEEFFQNDFSSAINSINEFTEDKPSVGSALNPEEKRTEAQTSTETTAVGASPEVPKETPVSQPKVTQVNVEVNVPNNQTDVINQNNEVKKTIDEFAIARRAFGLDLEVSANIQKRIAEQNQQVLNQTIEVQKKTDNLSSTFNLNTITQSSTPIVDSASLTRVKQEALNRLFVSKKSSAINPKKTGDTSQTDSINQNSEVKKQVDEFAISRKALGLPALESSDLQTTAPSVEADQTTEVTKTAPSFSEKIPQSSEKIIEKSNASMVQQTQSMLTATNTEGSNNQKTVEMNTVSEKKETTTSSTQSGMPAQGKVAINFEPIEARLARLEYILSNPLEVKIID